MQERRWKCLSWTRRVRISRVQIDVAKLFQLKYSVQFVIRQLSLFRQLPWQICNFFHEKTKIVNEEFCTFFALSSFTGSEYESDFHTKFYSTLEIFEHCIISHISIVFLRMGLICLACTKAFEIGVFRRNLFRTKNPDFTRVSHIYYA